jgi:hypothetical protein
MNKKTKRRNFFKVFLLSVVLMFAQGMALGFDTSGRSGTSVVMKRAAKEAEAGKKKAAKVAEAVLSTKGDAVRQKKESKQGIFIKSFG